MNKIGRYVAMHRKAIASAVVTLATYLGVEGMPETFIEWMLFVAVVGGAFGVPAAIRNYQPDVLVRADKGRLVAGDGASRPTGEQLSPYTTLGDVAPIA